MAHIAVLLQETIESLALRPGMTIVDGTFGGGNMSRAIAALIGKKGRLISFDRDKTVFTDENVRHLEEITQFVPIVGNFRNIGNELKRLGIDKIDGALFDLGLSSDQLEHSGRGFSFQRDEPLLMTFAAGTEPEDRSASSRDGEVTAEIIVNKWSEESIETILRGFGEERFARSIAQHIAEARKVGLVRTTGQLVEVIHQATPAWYRHGRTHFATRTFQALRIATNDELGAIPDGLKDATTLLVSGGRISVISFHSVEDRLVKQNLRELVNKGLLRSVFKKPLTASDEELLTNPRARSAKLRVAEKI